MNEKVINKQKLLLKKNYVDLSHFKKNHSFLDAKKSVRNTLLSMLCRAQLQLPSEPLVKHQFSSKGSLRCFADAHLCFAQKVEQK